MSEYMAWSKFLEFLRGPGVAAVVAILLSFVIEYFPKFEGLAPRYKRLVFAALCFVVPVIGTVLTCASGFGAWVDFEGLWWPALWAGGAAFGAGQLVHARRLAGRDEMVLRELPRRPPANW